MRQLSMFPYGGEPPAQQHSDTSKAAASRIKKQVGPMHIKVLQFLADIDGATDEQMQDQIPMSPNTQRPRRCELTQMGRIEDSGRRGLTKAGREAVVWRLVKRDA